MPNETFISYSRKDSDFVKRLCGALNKMGLDVWVDTEDIPHAVRWKQEILVAIQFCHNFLYLISPDSVNSQYCDLELDHALSLNKRLIPLLIRPVFKGGDSKEIRPSITELNWIFFDDFQLGVENLIEVLDSPLGTTFGDRLDAQIRIVDRLGCRTFPLYRNTYRVGRNPTATFAEAGLFFLGDEKVSRIHTTLFRRDGRWCVVDGLIQFNDRSKPINYQQSSNGVTIERTNAKGKVVSSDKLRRLQIRPLIHEDIVRLSPETSFIYEEISPDQQFRRIEADERDTAIDS